MHSSVALFDPDRHCGVQIGGRSANPIEGDDGTPAAVRFCRLSVFACREHSLAQRRTVHGRTAAHFEAVCTLRRREADQQEARLVRARRAAVDARASEKQRAALRAARERTERERLQRERQLENIDPELEAELRKHVAAGMERMRQMETDKERRERERLRRERQEMEELMRQQEKGKWGAVQTNKRAS